MVPERGGRVCVFGCVCVCVCVCVCALCMDACVSCVSDSSVLPAVEKPKAANHGQSVAERR